MIGVEWRRRAETAGKHAHVLLLPLVLRPVREQGDVLDRDLGLILAQSMKIASDSDRPRFGLPRKLSPQSLTASPTCERAVNPPHLWASNFPQARC